VQEEGQKTTPNPEIEDDLWQTDADLPAPLHEPDLASDEDHSDPEEELFEDPVPDPPTEADFEDEDSDLPAPLHEPDLAPDEDHSDLEEELFEEPLE
jgi:hypothetical protein